MVSFLQACLSKPCKHISSIPYIIHSHSKPILPNLHLNTHSSTSSKPMFSPQCARSSSKPTLNNRQNNSCAWIHMPGLCQQNQFMHVMLHSDHNNLSDHVQNNKQFKNHTLSAVLIRQRLV